MLIPLALLVAVLLAGCGHEEVETTERAEARPESVFEVTRALVADTYEASGSLRGQQTAVLTSKVTGYVSELRVEPGDRVESSRILAVLEAPELEAGLRASESGLLEAEQAVLQAEAGLAAAKAQAEVAYATFERFRMLQEKRAVTRQEFDEVQARHAAAEAQQSLAEAGLARARSARSRAEAEVARAKAFFEYTRVRAPFDGRVLEQQLDPGNLAAPGTPLFVVEKDGPLRAEVSVEESLAGRIHEGDGAEVFLARRDRPLDGVVTEVVPRVDVGSRAFLVKVELPASSQDELVPGSFARVRFTVGEHERLVVPRSAIVTRGQLSMVYVVDERSAELRLVTLGEERGEDVEVLSGLSEGDRILKEPARS